MMVAVGGFQVSRQGSIFKRVCGVGRRNGGADLDEVETGNLGGGLCKRNICRDGKQDRRREHGQSKEKNAAHSHGMISLQKFLATRLAYQPSPMPRCVCYAAFRVNLCNTILGPGAKEEPVPVLPPTIHFRSGPWLVEAFRFDRTLAPL